MVVDDSIDKQYTTMLLTIWDRTDTQAYVFHEIGFEKCILNLRKKYAQGSSSVMVVV